MLLEAYLTGCGESILRQFEHQSEMQTTLEEIATLVREGCGRVERGVAVWRGMWLGGEGCGWVERDVAFHDVKDNTSYSGGVAG